MRKKKRSQAGPGGDNPGNDKNPSDGRSQHLSPNVCGFLCCDCLIAAVMRGSQGLSNARLRNFSLACVKYEGLSSQTSLPAVTRHRTKYESRNESWAEKTVQRDTVS